MKKLSGRLSGFDRVVLVLSALFLVIAGLCFALGSRPSGYYRVETERNGPVSSAAAAGDISDAEQKEGERPDSLLEGEKIDLNTATRGDLTRLPGIGEARADAIIADREENGPFGSVDELTRVSGIGAKTLEGLREYVTVS